MIDAETIIEEITARDLLEGESYTEDGRLMVTVDYASPSIVERYEAKFGKKPHHRLKESSILAALNEPARNS